jgi:hypothetical protein
MKRTITLLLGIHHEAFAILGKRKRTTEIESSGEKRRTYCMGWKA